MILILIGDFNINIFEDTSDKNTLLRYLIEEKQDKLLINHVTTDYIKHKLITSSLKFLKE